MLPIYIALAVALICFILYALDRRFRSEPIDWMTAAKLTILGGLLSGGIAYTVSSPEVIVEAVKSVVPETPAVQEMFVGTPTF
jgi:predicted cation transporter